MNALKTALFSMMIAAMAPFAAAQDGGSDGDTRNQDYAKEPPLQYGDWMLDGMMDPGMQIRVRELRPGVVKFDVAPLDQQVGDVVIVICRPSGNQVEPIAILNAADPGQTTFAIRLEDFAKLDLAFFAVKRAKVQEEFELRFSSIARARSLAEKAKAQEPID